MLIRSVNHAACAVLIIGANICVLTAELGAAVAVSQRAPAIDGQVIGSVQVLSGESVALTGNAELSADLLVPGTPTVRAQGRSSYISVIDGSGPLEPVGYEIKLSGLARLRNIVRRSEPVALPIVPAPPEPTGTRRVTIHHRDDSPGHFSTIRDLRVAVSGDPVPVPPGSYGKFLASGKGGFVLGVAGSTSPTHYAFERLECEGHSSLNVVGPVIVTIGSAASFHGPAGDPAHPGWLDIRLAAGDMTLGGKAHVAASVSVPNGKLVLGGQSRLKGAVQVQRLTVAGAAMLELVEVSAVNQLPVVALLSPAAGENFTAPATIEFSASAEDPDGTVVLVEYYQNDVKCAESAVPPYRVVLGAVGEGTHVFSARATDDRGATASSEPVTITVGPEVPVRSLPFFAGFEQAEGYRLARLDGMKGWMASPDVVVTDADAWSGVQSALMPAGDPPRFATRSFDGGGGVVFVDGWILPAAGEIADAAALTVPNAASAVLLRDGASGRFSIRDGSDWLPVGPPIPLDEEGFAMQWTRVTMRIDYVRGRWDFHVNGRMEAAELHFPIPPAESFDSVEFSGRRASPTLLDAFYFGLQHPLFGDEDDDGMDDAWEVAHGLNPHIDDRDVDLDGDGLTNVIESIVGSDPSRIDSDQDGMPDGWEVTHGLSPTRRSDQDDTDADGVSDLIEFLQGRNPTRGTVPDQGAAVNLRVYAPRN